MPALEKWVTLSTSIIPQMLHLNDVRALIQDADQRELFCLKSITEYEKPCQNTQAIIKHKRIWRNGSLSICFLSESKPNDPVGALSFRA